MYLLREEVLSACDIASSDSVLVAFSGGADSVALLLEMKRFQDAGRIRAVSAAHLNHGIRGEEAERDAAFCRTLARELAVPFYEQKSDIPGIASEKKISLETAARQERYAFLNEILRKSGCSCIATGHHKDDQVETVLMHLIRGCGTEGLSGMRKRAGKIVRPLLDVTKTEILAYLQERGQSFCTDSTNDDPAYFRNRIRKELIPFLSELNPNITETVSQMAENVRQDADYLSEEAERVFQSVRNRKEIKQLPWPIRMRILRKYLPYDSFERTDLETLDTLLDAQTGMQRNLKNGYTAWVSSQELMVSFVEKDAYSFPLNIGRCVEVPSGTIEAKRCETGSFYRDRNVAFLDTEKVEGTLTVRSIRNGDRFTPFGMRGSKLLSDYFTDRKVPRFQRNVPVVCDEKGILYVAGFTVDERVRITGQTKEMIQIIYKESSEHVGERLYGTGDREGPCK